MNTPDILGQAISPEDIPDLHDELEKHFACIYCWALHDEECACNFDEEEESNDRHKIE